MARRERAAFAARATSAASAPKAAADIVLETPESTLVDVIDHLVNNGVMATGDVTLGVAGVDLIYLKLSAVLCAADRLLPLSKPAPVSKASGSAPVRSTRVTARQVAAPARRRRRRGGAR